MKGSRPTVVLTGGAGYIGRSLAFRLLQEGFDPIVFDNFSTSQAIQDRRLRWQSVELSNLGDYRSALARLTHIEALIHLAAKALVGESMENPWLYYRNNLLVTLYTAQLCEEFNIRKVLNSSSCSVYGIPTVVPIPEEHPLKPLSPYGETKLMSEQILEQLVRAGITQVAHLRYFNPAGATGDLSWGEAHEPETHLIPNVIRAFIIKVPIDVYGKTYNTPDGTCVRDFIHIEDLVDGHLLALRYLDSLTNDSPRVFNLGLGHGTSVLEVIHEAERVLGDRVPMRFVDPRPGDSPVLVADTMRARTLLGYRPIRSLAQMIQSHFQWAQSRLKFEI